MDWRLYEDVAHPEGWLEVWWVQNWTDHLREAVRLSEEDKQALAAVSPFHTAEAPLPCRYLAVDPRAAMIAQRDLLAHVGAGNRQPGASHA
jgi:hypothetical protein